MFLVKDDDYDDAKANNYSVILQLFLFSTCLLYLSVCVIVLLSFENDKRDTIIEASKQNIIVILGLLCAVNRVCNDSLPQQYGISILS